MFNIYNWSTLSRYIEENPDSELHLKAWYDTVKKSDWENPNQIKRVYGNASILKNSVVVFNIKGNDYRLIAKFDYKKRRVLIRFIGTHKEYDQIPDASEL